MQPPKRLVLPREGLVPLEVVHPEQRGKDETKGRREQAAGQAEEVVEDGHGLADDKSERAEDEVDAEPGGPVDDGVGLQVARVAQQAHEQVFGRDVLIDAVADDEAGQRDAVADLLEEGARAAERRRRQPLPGVPVDDQAEDEVQQPDDDAVDVAGLAVVLRAAHLGDDGEVHCGMLVSHCPRICAQVHDAFGLT